jgi:hypothetical protein
MKVDSTPLQQWNHYCSTYIMDKCYKGVNRPMDPIMNVLYEYPVYMPRTIHDAHHHTGYISVEMKGMLVLLHKLLYA